MKKIYIILFIILVGCSSPSSSPNPFPSDFNAQGTFTDPNRKKYVGEWKEGRPNGQGTDIFPDGSKGIGEFREGRPWNITHRDKNGKIIVKFVNGKEIRP